MRWHACCDFPATYLTSFAFGDLLLAPAPKVSDRFSTSRPPARKLAATAKDDGLRTALTRTVYLKSLTPRNWRFGLISQVPGADKADFCRTLLAPAPKVSKRAAPGVCAGQLHKEEAQLSGSLCSAAGAGSLYRPSLACTKTLRHPASPGANTRAGSCRSVFAVLGANNGRENQKPRQKRRELPAFVGRPVAAGALAACTETAQQRRWAFDVTCRC